MKIALGLLAAVVLGGVSFSACAQTPQGSYLGSCTNVRMEGRTLTAVCRRADGREQRATLGDVNQCIGDIGNNNGVLRCNRGQAPAPGYGEAPTRDTVKRRPRDMVKLRPRDMVKLRPRDTANRPRDMANRPRDMANRPQDMANRLRDTANRPRDMANRPRDMANRPRDTGGKN